ncbi:hypothetical protein DXG01_012709, partial [Tephrocybe rancida]
AEDKTLKEKEARKVERLGRAYASIICKRKRDIEEVQEVWIRRKIVTRPTKKLRTAVGEVMETAKSVIVEAAVVVLDAVAAIGSVSRAVFGCTREVQKNDDQEDFEPSIPGGFPDDRKQEIADAKTSHAMLDYPLMYKSFAVVPSRARREHKAPSSPGRSRWDPICIM